MQTKTLQSIKRVLIANRGEIAVRCIRACQKVGVTNIAIYTQSDASSLHVANADEALLLEGEGTAGYLDIDDIIQKCKQGQIDAVVPGYGFLSESVEFARSVAQAGMVFVGPSPESISEMGLKHRTREVAMKSAVPTVPGTNLLASESEAIAAAELLEFPVMVKSTGGGGGMGLQICHSVGDMSAAFAAVKSRGEALFKNSGIFLEKYYPQSRHIEVQVFGNGADIIHFGERECSIQRRHQKVIEECPSPFVEAHPGLRQRLVQCATRYASALNYKSAGTVEFLVDDETGDHFFLEMNTRLQVEHGITELCYGVDLVVLMLQQADQEHLGNGGIASSELHQLMRPNPDGAAIEARIYAEDPYRNFAPSPGVFREVFWPGTKGVRIDTWIRSGQDVGLHYDPLIAKVMVHAASRTEAIAEMHHQASESIILEGPMTNLDFVRAVIGCEAFGKGDTLTNFLDSRFNYQPCGIDFISGGSFSTVQDYPGRPSIGHGIPKSGPVDTLSSRIANLLVGNDHGTEVIEVTLVGPKILFTTAAVFSVCGARAPVLIDGAGKPMWSTLVIQAGQTLDIGTVTGAGCRVYLAIRGGFPKIPPTFGSKSTTASLKFGGYQGRSLRKGDFIQLARETSKWAEEAEEYSLPASLMVNVNIKEIYVLQGPHDTEDIMTSSDRDMLYTTEWGVGHNSNRTGVRLVGPNPQWARNDGGEAGSHPSNYLDYGYPTGGVNWGGDSSCVLSVDSPNFGGLVCSSTIISADLWKLGQLKPGDSFLMVPISLDEAVRQISTVDQYLTEVERVVQRKSSTYSVYPWGLKRRDVTPNAAILMTTFPDAGDSLRPKVTYRQGGDRFLLMELGNQSTDLAVVTRIRVLLEKMKSQTDLNLLFTVHVGSITVEYNPLEISQGKLLERIIHLDSTVEATIDLIIPSREIRLPLVMDHPDIQQCNERYMETIRDKAVYLPDNIEYLRKCNGLQSRREVFDMMLNTEYLVVAVGFLCGAPILFPLSPKKLQCQKYNPTRLSTPGGTIGVGGSILHGYTIEQPGGFVMAARTLEMWDSLGIKPGFEPQKPWLFESYDIVKFYEVSVDEYDILAERYAAGTHQWQISPSSFDIRSAYDRLQQASSNMEISKYQNRQHSGLKEQEKIEKELYVQWEADTNFMEGLGGLSDTEMIENDLVIASPTAANVWKVEVSPGEDLRPGKLVAVLEAMKMEISVYAPENSDGHHVHAIFTKPKSIVNPGDILVVARKTI